MSGYKEFDPAQMRDLKKLIEKYKYDMVDDCVDYFVKNSRVTLKKINRKLK